MTLEDNRVLLELWKAPEGTAEPKAALVLPLSENAEYFVNLDNGYEWEEFPDPPKDGVSALEYLDFMIQVAEEYAKRISPHNPLHSTYKTYAINLKELRHRIKKDRTQ